MPAPAAAPTAAPPTGSRRGWKLLVSLALLVLLVLTQDLGGVLSLLAGAADAWLALAVAVMFVEQSLTALIWQRLLAARGLHVGVLEVLRIYYLSIFIGTWLPSSTGPDVLRAYYLARHVDGYDAVGSMLVLRFVSLLALGLFAVAGVGLVPAPLPPAALVLAWLLVAGSAGALLVGLTEAPRRAATAILQPLRLAGPAAVLGKLHAALHAYRRAPGELAVATVLSLIVQLLRIVTIYLAARALGIEVPFAPYLVLVPVTTMITLVPISLAGLGVREGAFVYFFSRAGMSEAGAFSLSLLVFGLSLVLWLVGAALYWRDVPPGEKAASSPASGEGRASG
ncbi:MAG TPA: lysylphosphatidylglycerol synthase transmembrane domain-containing protein [Acidobacteriota bacterium]